MTRFLILLVPVALAFTGCKSGKSGSSRVNKQSDTSVLRKAAKQIELEKAQNAPTAAEVKLTNEETKKIYDVIDSKMLIDDRTKIMSSVVGAGMVGSEIGMAIKGDKDNATIILTHKKEIIAEFKDINFKLKEKTEKNSNEDKDYKMLAYCAGEKCELIFISIYKAEKNEKTEKYEVKENYPAIFKLDPTIYKRAQRAY